MSVARETRRDADALTVESVTTAVIDHGRCVGFLLARGPAGIEAFDKHEQSLGLFPNEYAAVAAVWRQAHGQHGRGQ
jgi:hypothetical protein